MIRLISLSSGSCGNAIYIESSRTKLLIDAGPTLKYLGQQLSGLDVKLDQLDAVLLTHEHHDHICSATSLSKRYGVKILANAETLDALPSKFGAAEIRVFPNERSFEVGDFEITAVPHSHDCIYPVGFILRHGAKKISVSTDLGRLTRHVEDGLRGSDIVVLESNHDFKMLAHGRYPPRLKARIASEYGHLSNSMASQLLSRIATGKEQKVLLAHLSEENNTPEIAIRTARDVLSEHDIDSVQLGIAPRLRPSALITT